jgi:hypothetical protein
MSMIHARDRATPEKINNAPGTFFSHGESALALSDRITRPMIIKIAAITDNETKTVVDNILKRFMVMLKLIHVILKW